MSREIQWLWPTPIMHYNLRESGRVDAGLHDALQAFSERNQGRLLNDEKRSATLETLYTRYDTGIFKRTRNPQLKAIRQLILEECDDYAAQVYGDQVRQARRDHTMWFVMQRSGQAKDAVHAHYHEGSDLAFVYYLTMPKDGSGQLVLMGGCPYFLGEAMGLSQSGRRAIVEGCDLGLGLTRTDGRWSLREFAADKNAKIYRFYVGGGLNMLNSALPARKDFGIQYRFLDGWIQELSI
nr:hypothetical protein [Achromobacter ruhlandii]